MAKNTFLSQVKKSILDLSKREYVVESGEKENWKYKKISDGTVIATQKKIQNLSNYSTPINGMSGYQITLKLPQGVFVKTDYTIGECKIGNGFSIFSGNLGNLSPEEVKLFAMSTATGNVETVWHIKIYGKWK